jgi:hypothetical protein
MTEPQLRALFKEMAEGTPADSRVDPALARRRGRVQLRWRRAGVAGTSVVAVAAAGAVSLAVGLSPFRPASGSAAAGAVAPRQFNPLVPYLSFGWLPAGESMVRGWTGKTVMALDAAPSPSERWAVWDLSVYTAGACKLAAKQFTCSPDGRIKLDLITGRAPDVRGRPAFWSGSGLVWQYASHGWGRLVFPYPFNTPQLPKTIRAGTVTPGTTRATVKHNAIKLVSRLKVGVATQPLVFPAQFTGVPSQWQVASAQYVPDGAVLRASSYTLNAAAAAGARDTDAGLSFQDNLPYVEISPVSAHPPPCSYSMHNTRGNRTVHKTINGYRVIVNHQHGHTAAIGSMASHLFRSQALCTANAGGLAVNLSETGPHPALSVASLFKDHLRLLGTNPADWTTKPIE